MNIGNGFLKKRTRIALNVATIIVMLITLMAPFAGRPVALAAAPVAPSSLTASVVSTTRVDLSWTDNSNNEVSFRIERSLNSFATAPGFTATVALNLTGYSDTAVTASATYFYRVIAVNADGDSTPSNVASITVASPVPPSDLSATAMSATRVDLIWTDQSNNEASFRVERSLDNFATAPTATFAAALNQRTFSDTTVGPTNTYSYRVVAVNAVGTSVPSNTAMAIVTSNLQVGPIDPATIYQGNSNTGWPSYYQDDQGTRVSLFPTAGNGVTAPTQIFDPPDPSNPYSVFLNLGAEGFYWLAEAGFNTSAGKGLVEFAVEAAFAAEDPAPGDEFVFTRTRIRIDVPVPGTYTVQHPYGTHIFHVTEIVPGQEIRYVQDIGAPRNFLTAAEGPVSRFLRQTAPPPPAGWIGDGVSVGPVTGSPTGFNKVRVTGPVGSNLDGAGNNFVQTDQFFVAGRLLTATPPVPSFTKALSPSNGVAPATVTFTNITTGSVPASYLWDFGDGTTSTLQNPVKVYSAAGNYLVRLTVTNAAGTASTSQTVSIYSAPVAGFSNSLPNGIPPATINFTDASTGNPATWSWTFGDSGTSSLQNPSHIYMASGTYTITLTVTNPAGTASVSKTMGISGNLVPGFTMSLNPTTGVAPLTVSFTGTSTGTIISRSWNFGDGATSTLQNATRTYNTAGKYTITLIVTDAVGTAATSQTVNVYSTPSASFSRSPGNGPPPLTVNFADTSTGNPASWSWNFGDGTTSSIQNPSKTYTLFGTYTVILTATNPAGTASASRTVTVSTVNPASLKLQAGPIEARTIYQGNPDTGWPAYYQDDQGTRVSLFPTIGNGVTAPTQIFDPPDQANPYSVFLNLGAEGFYWLAEAGFNTSAGRGLVEFAVEAAFVTEDPAPGDEFVFTRTRIRIDVPVPGTYTVQHPYGTHTFVVTEIVPGQEIRYVQDIGAPRDFLAAATGPVSRFLRQTAPPPPNGWIGDGVSVGPVTGSPTGFNRVRVTGPVGSNLDGAGNNFVQTDQFFIAGRLLSELKPSFTRVLTPSTGVVPVTAAFTGIATGSIPTSWLWSFGDGTTSTLQNATKIYTAAGNYTVMLTVSDAINTAATSQIVSIYSTPTASFNMSATSGFAPLTVNFSDTSTGNPASWSWTFGNGAASALQNPSHVYTASGTYTVTLTVASPAGTATTSRLLSVIGPGGPPAAPSALFATVINANRVDLAWTDKSSNESSFLIERSTSGITFAQIGVVNANVTAFSDTSVTASASFFYRVIASNASGNSQPSNAVQVIVALPQAPTGLGAVAAAFNSVNLSWTDNASNETGYRVERAFSGNSFATIATLAVNSTSYSDTAVQANTAYQYRIAAFNAIGSSATGPVSVTTPSQPPAPETGGGGGGGGGSVGGGSAGGGSAAGGSAAGGGAGLPVTSTGTPVAIMGFSSSTAPLALDSAGKAVSRAVIQNGAGTVFLTIGEGTQVTDENKKPLSVISATPLNTPPSPPPGAAILFAYNLFPGGAQFSPPISLTMNYDASKLPAGARESSLFIAFWDGTKWVSLGGKVDAVARTVTAEVSHFTEFAIIAAPETPPAPVPLPVPISIPAPAPTSTATAIQAPVEQITPPQVASVISPTEETSALPSQETLVMPPPFSMPPPPVQLPADSSEEPGKERVIIVPPRIPSAVDAVDSPARSAEQTAPRGSTQTVPLIIAGALALAMLLLAFIVLPRIVKRRVKS